MSSNKQREKNGYVMLIMCWKSLTNLEQHEFVLLLVIESGRVENEANEIMTSGWL